MNKQEDRHLELSAKLLEMGQALMKEGKEDNDFRVAQMGHFIAFIGSLIFVDKDMYLFSQICSMFSSKRILDEMEEQKNNPFLSDLQKRADNTSYDEFIKRINKLRRDNGIEPEEEK